VVVKTRPTAPRLLLTRRPASFSCHRWASTSEQETNPGTSAPELPYPKLASVRTPRHWLPEVSVNHPGVLLALTVTEYGS
jgi:hypothetical protein